MKLNKWLIASLLLGNSLFSQTPFDYKIEFNPISITGLPGLHSYAFAQAGGKWLIIGGRKDGIHARQPFAAFPVSQNNTFIYVVDVTAQIFWSAPIDSLPMALKDQLQSTNMNFFQDDDTLYIVGGYGFSTSANSNITFPNLTSVQVSSLMNDVISANPIRQHFKQINHANFAITGGQLGKIGNTFYLVGGQKFDGDYNPMGHNTYTQVYSNQIRKFEVNNSGTQLSFKNYAAISDAVHLRRRDYNLLPQIFPDGSEGYTISSGVFQLNADLPFLYPVDIKSSGYAAVTSFNQYLSNYHGATASFYDSTGNSMHNLFFGGISQYYYDGTNLVQDNQVPFVKTISRLSRASNGDLQEYQMSTQMPGYKGASAEFISNQAVPHYASEIFKLNEFNEDTVRIGHIFGGISSPSMNPFSNNQTSSTSADHSIYEVLLIKTEPTAVLEIDGKNPYQFDVYPNPLTDHVEVKFYLKKGIPVEYYVSDSQGKLIKRSAITYYKTGENIMRLEFNDEIAEQNLLLTLVFDGKYFVSKRLLKN